MGVTTGSRQVSAQRLMTDEKPGTNSRAVLNISLLLPGVRRRELL
jgi:hypothetical protein